MLIKVLNRHDFKSLMIANNIDQSNIGELKNTYIISINDHSGENSVSYFENVESDNVLVLHFDDTDDNIVSEYIPMSTKQGELIISFMDMIKSKSNKDTQLLIHCTAGQNRSGSVGRFAVDYLDYDIDIFNSDNPIVKGNPIVSSILNRLWLWGHYLE